MSQLPSQVAQVLSDEPIMITQGNDLISLNAYLSSLMVSRSVNEMCLDPAWEKVCGHYKLVSYLGEGSYG